jgi:DNA-binding transcriptional LysR family regulator
MTNEFDLNLLRVFDALMDTGSVSAAAARLHLSVPATSRALGRLRQAMDDPIFVRAGRGLTPTPFALRSAGRVRALLEQAAELRADKPDGDPATWRRSFAVRINDGLTPVLAPRLLSRIAREAPDVRLRFITDDSDHPDALRDGSIDLDIGIADTPPPDVSVQKLLVDRHVALVCAGSAMGRARRLTVDQLVDHPHITSVRGARVDRILDEALEQIGRSRRVIAVVPSYAVCALLALEDNVIAVVPGLLAQHLIDRHVPVRCHELPLTVPRLSVDVRWHRRLHADRPAQWLREHITSTIHDLAGPPQNN